MKRLKQYINENTKLTMKQNILQSRDFIDFDCKKYIKETGGLKGFVYRGFTDISHSTGVNDILLKHKVRKDRKPRFIPPSISDFISDWSKKKIGWDIRREGLFTGSKKTSQIFSEGSQPPRAVFPIGDFKYVIMTKGQDLKDLYGIYDDATFAYFPFDDEEYNSETQKQLIGLLKQYKKNKGMVRAVMNAGLSWECIINCDEYYTISMEMADNYFKDWRKWNDAK